MNTKKIVKRSIVLVTIVILLSSAASANFVVQDLTTYDESDPNNDITVTSNSVTISGAVANQDGSLGTDAFYVWDRNSTYNFTLNRDSQSEAGSRFMIGWEKTQRTEVSSAFLGVGIFTDDITIQEGAGGSEATNVLTNIDDNTDYYISAHMDAQTGTFTVSVYSDSERTNLLASNSVSYPTSTHYEYFYAAISGNPASTTDEFYGTFSDFSVDAPDEADYFTSFDPSKQKEALAVSGFTEVDNKSLMEINNGKIIVTGVENTDIDENFYRGIEVQRTGIVETHLQFTVNGTSDTDAKAQVMYSQEVVDSSAENGNNGFQINVNNGVRIVNRQSGGGELAGEYIEISNDKQYYARMIYDFNNNTNTVVIYNDSSLNDRVGFSQAPLTSDNFSVFYPYISNGGILSTQYYGTFSNYSIYHDGQVPDIPDALPSDSEIQIRINTWMRYNTTQPYTILAVSNHSVTDITDVATVTTNNSTLITVNTATNQLIATNNTSVKGRTYIQADYQSFSTTKNVTVANLTLDNIEILPSAYWLSAFLGIHDEQAAYGIGSESQFIYFAILIGAVLAWKARNEYLGIGVILAALILFWVLEKVTVGIVLVGLFYGIFAAYQLLQTPSRSDTNVGGLK